MKTIMSLSAQTKIINLVTDGGICHMILQKSPAAMYQQNQKFCGMLQCSG